MLALASVLVVPSSFAQFAHAVVGYVPGAGYDLAWAQDTNGQPVALTSERFVSVEVLSGK